MNAYIFDVDGVITDPTTKLPQDKVLDILLNKLKKNEPIAFNTGRSVRWVYEKVIKNMGLGIKDLGILNNLFVIGEFGGTMLEFNKAGKPQFSIDENIKTPKYLEEKANLILKEYNSSMFHNNSEDKKETMISSEMLTNFSLEKYHEEQEKLFERWRELVKALKLEGKYKVSKGMIGTDIMNINVGKKFATKKTFIWLREKGFNPRDAYIFGDSELDILMAEESFEEGIQTTFVFVGGNISKDYPFTVIETDERFTEGTLEYLTKFT